ncbi:MAG: leucine-rich repeat protein [Prevotella sp.]|nr:leucine-rich repeat protein [Prevotella sp.]
MGKHFYLWCVLLAMLVGANVNVCAQDDYSFSDSWRNGWEGGNVIYAYIPILQGLFFDDDHYLIYAYDIDEGIGYFDGIHCPFPDEDNNCQHITSVDIAGTLSLDDFNLDIYDSFYNWDYLQQFGVPITRVSPSAFTICVNLSSVYMPWIEEIGRDAFNSGLGWWDELDDDNASPLSYAYMPNVRAIGMGAFCNCKNIRIDNQGYMGSQWQVVETGAFSGCSSLETVDDLSNVTEIGEYAFAGCTSWSTANLSSLTSLGRYAFDGCTSLSNLTLPEYGLQEIKEYTFQNCQSLNTVELPSSCTVLGEGAFKGCSSLKSANVIMVEDLGGGAFWNCSALTSVVLPPNLSVVPADCFLGCSSLESITIPETVEMISYAAFAQSGLKSIELPEGLQTIGSCAFYECKDLSLVNIPQSVNKIYSSAFYNTAIKNVDFPTGLKVIEYQAFQYCRKLESVTFREGLETIGYLAFCGDVALSEIVLPKSLKQIGAFAFELCTGLQTVECKSTEPPVWNQGSWTLQEGQNPVFGSLDLPNITLYVPAGCKAKYLASDIWKDFNIVERGGGIVPTGIDIANEEAGHADGRVYDLQGRLVSTSGEVVKSGVYVKNGKKVLIK